MGLASGSTISCFYPRHPRGWRQKAIKYAEWDKIVSIHATLAGGDQDALAKAQGEVLFLSTPPSRVATRLVQTLQTRSSFYPRHPRGWRPEPRFMKAELRQVSIHATLAGGDITQAAKADLTIEFLSTPPSRVATMDFVTRFGDNWVSIHATLAGGDQDIEKYAQSDAGFYPRHPRGWRQTG